MRAPTSLAAPLLAVGVVSQAGGPDTQTIIRYVANAGMLVTVDGHDVLIDAPIREGIAPHPTSSTDERRRLESARPPYDRVEAILITHWHEDHFSAGAITAHLATNQRATVISSPEVINRIRDVAPLVPASRFRAHLPAPGQSELACVGADPVADTFALLATMPRVDLALLPYWYVLTDNSRRMVSTAIAPGRIIAMHLPAEEAGTLTRALEGWELPVARPGPPGQVVTGRR